MKAPLILSTLLCCWHMAIAGTGYPNTEAMGDLADKQSEWYRACMAAEDALPPIADMPSDAQKRSVAGCVPEDLYYDTKHHARRTDSDWARVRACAFAQHDEGVLMMLYANGLGVKKNPLVATRFACLFGGTPAEATGRVAHLRAMGSEDSGPAFDICDDATSGFMAGYCASIEDRQRTRDRTEKLAQIGSRLDARAHSAFEQLQAALSAFAERRGDSETDMTGTARAALSIQASAEEYDAFMGLLEKVESDSLQKVNHSEALERNREMHRSLQQVISSKGPQAGAIDRLGDTTITRTGIAESQRAWNAYRDTWMRFARTRHPRIDPDSLAGHLTTRHIEQLRALLAEVDE
ncbi:hypothetical protein Q3O97_19805 [Ralstonia pseudosolanacearum]|uniref:hypothetical protein n=1 Tax=Ralstonia pseudosolanacearum TaxID=1310165 RepID=UPI00270631FA|nr:hypothetical protein [Ralstonia pseudosolanacearum]MDO3618092.1 hypothetical protein [Ralstonia pseudosolanacearum]